MLKKRGQINTFDLAFGVVLFILTLTLLYSYIGEIATETVTTEMDRNYDLVINNLEQNLELDEYLSLDGNFTSNYKIYYENLKNFAGLAYSNPTFDGLEQPGSQKYAVFANLFGYETKRLDFCIYLLDKDNSAVPIEVGFSDRNGIGNELNTNITLNGNACGTDHQAGVIEPECKTPPYFSTILVSKPAVLINHNTLNKNMTVRLNVLICEKK